jgi:hypothetical protein
MESGVTDGTGEPVPETSPRSLLASETPANEQFAIGRVAQNHITDRLDTPMPNSAASARQSACRRRNCTQIPASATFRARHRFLLPEIALLRPGARRPRSRGPRLRAPRRAAIRGNVSSSPICISRQATHPRDTLFMTRKRWESQSPGTPSRFQARLVTRVIFRALRRRWEGFAEGTSYNLGNSHG